jgi:diguanylate cyclase (GGDEF)-like protein/PAS domain S-box-containing protein
MLDVSLFHADDQDFFILLDNIGEGVYVVDQNRTILFWNQKAEEITGYSADEVVGHSCRDNILNHVDAEGCNICQHNCPLLNVKKAGDSYESELFLHHKKGHRIPVHVRSTCLASHDGLVIEFFSDLSPLRSLEQRVAELEEMAFFDPLTEIGNRRYGEMQLDIRQLELERHKWPYAFFIMDIDLFKKVNDTYGHDIGDKVLRMVAQTINRNCRAYDLVVRWGGEEFIGILRNVDEGRLHILLEKFRLLIAESFLMLENGEKLAVTASFGGVLVDQAMNIETIYKIADDNLYKSKKSGRNKITL